MAEETSAAYHSAGDESVICLLRFSKIREFKGVKSVSNAFSTSLLQINPNHPEIEEFKELLLDDGLALTLAESIPQSMKKPNNEIT
ncbi:unnamed protein product [Microthlaspi erraticum]|nr:unnamed protein product [Microthlaspi erraticum]CAA7051875.1 unnamed protein product [Microthlaspi erraticum]CAA7059231.1 unnamed protein product [Microthlaspi erraticum]